jgi:hypothetical protein
MIGFPLPLLTAGLTIFLFLAQCAVLVLVTVSLRRPATLPLVVASGLLVLQAAVVAISPINVPAIAGLILALLGITVAVVGGNPVTRQVLHLATGGRVHETEDGGILVATTAGAEGDGPQTTTLLRGGTTIGYLERLAVVVSIVAGFPEALAVVVAVKGIGRFSELASAEARERFIIGTLASLLWAGLCGALIHLAIR